MVVMLHRDHKFNLKVPVIMMMMPWQFLNKTRSDSKVVFFEGREEWTLQSTNSIKKRWCFLQRIKRLALEGGLQETEFAV